MRVGIAATGKSYQLQHFRRTCATGIAGQVGQPKGDIVRHRQMWEQRVVLEHHPHATLIGRHNVSDCADRFI